MSALIIIKYNVFAGLSVVEKQNVILYFTLLRSGCSATQFNINQKTILWGRRQRGLLILFFLQYLC